MNVCCITCKDLDTWVKTKAKPGDVAYWYDQIHDQRYYYFYTEPDPKPFWRLWFNDDVTDKYLEEINKLTIEEPKMDKRCENCKYFKSGGALCYCSHKEHNGVLVPKFVSCTEHEPKPKIEAPFDNLKFFIKDQKTGELEVKYICEDCGKIMEAPFHWQFRVPFGANKDPEKRPGYYYWCESCWEKESKK